MLERMRREYVRELLLSKGLTDEECSVVERIVVNRRLINDLSVRSLEAGWGWHREYDRISRDEFLLCADSLIARHETLLKDLAGCLQQLRPVLDEVVGMSEALIGQMDRAGRFRENPDVTRLIGLVVVRTNERFFGTLGDLYGWLLELEQGYVEHFHHLKAAGAASVTETLIQPSPLAELENRIAARIHQNASRRVDEAELYNAIAPSAMTEAVLAHSMTQARYYEFCKMLSQLERISDPQKVLALAEEARWMVGMMRLAGPVGGAAVPSVEGKFEGLAEDLRSLGEALEVFAADLSGSKPLGGTRADTCGIIEAAGRIDRTLALIDRMLMTT